MKDYLMQILHQEVTEVPFQETEKLPLVYRNLFKLSLIKIAQSTFLLAEPVEAMNLTELRKRHIQLERLTAYPCVFGLEDVNWYAAPKMVEDGIPFIWSGHQVYLPFLGMLLKENEGRSIKSCAQISFLTQKLLLKALYENWQDITASKAAELLGVSRMSVTRCFDEIEALELPFLTTKKRSRRFCAMLDRKEMWNTIRPCLRSPLVKEFRLAEPLQNAENVVLSGISALAEYSMLCEDECKTYAAAKADFSKLNIGAYRKTTMGEDPVCIVQEIGYLLPYGSRTAIDPLSLTIILTDNDLEDPRVKISVSEMLEELVW